MIAGLPFLFDHRLDGAKYITVRREAFQTVIALY